MTEPRKLTATLVVDGDSISGVVTDHDGTRRQFTGWLELISILQQAPASQDQTSA